jgi:Cu-processing system permease protein
MKMLLMARFTIREALHKRVVHGVLALTVAFVLLFALAVWFAYRETANYMDLTLQQLSVRRMWSMQFTLLGMNAVSGIGALLAIFLSVGTISAEVDGGTLQAIVPKPLTRRDILLGKWLGYAITLSIYVFALSLIVIGTVGVFSRIWSSNFIVAPLPLVLQSLLLLSLSVLGTTFLPTVANGVVVFGLYSIATMSGFVEQLGSLLHNDSMINIGIVTSLIIPSDSMGKLAASILHEGASYAERMGGPFIVNSAPSGLMVVYTLVYMAVVLLVAQRIFAARDL